MGRPCQVVTSGGTGATRTAGTSPASSPSPRAAVSWGLPPPPDPMAHDVFVSHASRDKPVADAACAALEQAGIRCWVAPRDIVPGTDWGSAIIQGIRGSRLMVLVFSSHANASPHISREVERAMHLGIPVVPFRIDESVPEGSLEYHLGLVHWLDALTPPLEQHLGRLVGTVRGTLAAMPPRPVPEEMRENPPVRPVAPEPVPEERLPLPAPVPPPRVAPAPPAEPHLTFPDARLVLGGWFLLTVALVLLRSQGVFAVGTVPLILWVGTMMAATTAAWHVRSGRHLSTMQAGVLGLGGLGAAWAMLEVIRSAAAALQAGGAGDDVLLYVDTAWKQGVSGGVLFALVHVLALGLTWWRGVLAVVGATIAATATQLAMYVLTYPQPAATLEIQYFAWGVGYLIGAYALPWHAADEAERVARLRWSAPITVLTLLGVVAAMVQVNDERALAYVTIAPLTCIVLMALRPVSWPFGALIAAVPLGVFFVALGVGTGANATSGGETIFMIWVATGVVMGGLKGGRGRIAGT